MSLTNDQITAKNFQEFYAQIRPYLNGQVPPVFNKFSKSDLYSESEQIVGRWINGKPVYQKTFTGTTESNMDDTAIDLPSGTQVIDIFGYVCSNGNTNRFPINMYYRSDLYVAAYISTESAIILKTSRSAERGQVYYCTIQYTKTADSSVEIGNDTDYSTTEKIVGTWIDGKPLYQKTKEYTDVSVSNSWTDLDVSFASNIDELVYADFFTTSASGTFIDKTSVKISCQSGVLKIRSSDAGTLAKITITGKYTKS